MLYIPKGFAHGFQTLTDATLVSYLMSQYCVPSAARGIHHADPTLAIPWPVAERIVSPRDAAFGGLP